MHQHRVENQTIPEFVVSGGILFHRIAGGGMRSEVLRHIACLHSKLSKSIAARSLCRGILVFYSIFGGIPADALPEQADVMS